MPKRPRRQRERYAADAREHDRGPGCHRHRAQQWPDQRAEDRRGEHRAERLAAPFSGRDRDHPGEAAAPDAAARDALDEPQAVERHDVRSESECDDRDGEQQQAGHSGATHARAGCDPSTEQRARKHPRGVGGGEHADRRLGRPERVRVVRQHRGEDRIQDRLEPQQHADQHDRALLGLEPARCRAPRARSERGHAFTSASASRRSRGARSEASPDASWSTSRPSAAASRSSASDRGCREPAAASSGGSASK